MKKILVIALVTIFSVGCNDKTASTASAASDSTNTASTNATEENLDYPYQLDHPYADWQPGDKRHALAVMQSLKAYETGDINTCVAGFGDSVRLLFDGYRGNFSKDSLKKMFTESRDRLSALKIMMSDWESVISKDKKQEYVTMWYKQIETDKKGKTDSLSIVDDAKIVNGKIVELDQKIQHFPPPMANKK